MKKLEGGTSRCKIHRVPLFKYFFLVEMARFIFLFGSLILKYILRRRWIIFCLKSNKEQPSSGINILNFQWTYWKVAVSESTRLTDVAIFTNLHSVIFVAFFSIFPQLFVCAVALFKLFASTAFPTKTPILSGCWLLKKLWIISGSTLLTCFKVASEVEVPYVPVLKLLHAKCCEWWMSQREDTATGWCYCYVI